MFSVRLDAVNCKRVNVAGSQAAAYLQRLLQLKYPGHVAAITLSRMEELLHEHSYTAVDYHQGAHIYTDPRTDAELQLKRRQGKTGKKTSWSFSQSARSVVYTEWEPSQIDNV